MRISKTKLQIAMARKLFNAPDLAKEAGISYAEVSYLLSGKRNPTIKTVGKIAKALNIDVTEILEEE